MPDRIQLSRAKGWRMPPNTVNVARPGRFGNPFRAGSIGTPDAFNAVANYRNWMRVPYKWTGHPWPPSTSEIVLALRGRDLACWCPLDCDCHADVLLEIAND